MHRLGFAGLTSVWDCLGYACGASEAAAGGAGEGGAGGTGAGVAGAGGAGGTGAVVSRVRA